MPKYQTYGDYDPERDDYVETAEKEVRGGDILRANEEQATKSEPKKGFYKKDSDTAVTANKREGAVSNATSGLYAGLNGAKSKSRGGRFTRRLAPLFFILGVTGAGAIGIVFSQVMMPFHVIESLTEMTDGSFTARQARMPKLVRWMFNMEAETEFTTKYTSLLPSAAKMKYRRNITSKRVQQRLANEGIEVRTESDVPGGTVLYYKNSDGVDVRVTADDYADFYRNDVDFRNKMNRGGRSFLGRIAAHIDLTLANFLNSHSLTKNLFEGWINKVYDAEGQTTRLHNVIEARKPDTTGDVTAQKTLATDEGAADADATKNVDIDPKADTESLGGKYTEMISNVASITTSAVCGTAAIASAVTAARLVIAYENSRGAFSGFAEAVDKVKAGHGDESPINATADMMIKRDENGLTMLQSEQMKWAISGGTYKPNKNAEDVVNTSSDAIFRGDGGLWSELGNISTSTKWIIGCAAANVATAAVSLVATIATLGTFSVGKLALAAGGGLIVTGAVTKLTEMLVNNAKSDFCLDENGPSTMKGACVYLGASNYNGINFQNGGGSLATVDKAKEFYKSYKVALADEAELIRETKSPFDISSSHTFLGSIVSQLSMLAIEMPNLSSMASALTGLASTALTSLLPSAAAAEEVSFFNNELRDDCTNLDFGSFKAIGDLNCEAWYITDQTLNKIEHDEIMAKLAEWGQFEMENGVLKLDENDNEIINPDGDLAKYISYCDYRTSPFGHVDQNIMNAESQMIDSSGSKGLGKILKDLLSTIVNNFPLIGDIVQMTEATKQVETLGWSTGANCVARTGADEIVGESSDEVPWTMSVPLKSWDEFMRYAQGYVADDRYMQTASEDYVSPVQTYVESVGLLMSEDVSFVEYLARYSGYTVEDMKIALNELEYWTYVAQYEPEGKGPIVFDDETEEVYDFELPGREIYENYEEQIAVSWQRVVYADLRNRYSAVA